MYNPTLLHAPNTHEMPSWIEEQQRQAREQSEDDAEDEEENDDESEAVEDEEGPRNEAEVDEVVDPQQAKYDLDDDPSAAPAILITTSMPSNSTSPHLASANARSHPAEAVRDLIKDLLNVFPGAEYRPRAKARGAGLGKICGWARARRYDAVMVIGESNKKPCTMTLVALPLGPTALFRLTSVSLTKDIAGHARATPHTPERS